MYERILGLILSIYLVIVKVFSVILPSKKLKPSKTILLTGNFYSEAWIKSQLEVFEFSEHTDVVYMVAENQVPDIPKVVAKYAPAWMNKLLGKDIARLVYFGFVAIKLRPDVIGGFHLLLNGLASLLLAKLVGARSLYVCGGGIREIEGGGHGTENRIFGRISGPNPSIEAKLGEAVKRFDHVVVRGTSAKAFLCDHIGVNPANIFIITAGMNVERFKADPNAEKQYDVVFVGRISEVKRLNIPIEALGELKSKRSVSLVVVGDGPDRQMMEDLGESCGVRAQITFAGWQNRVEDFLNQSRTFVLTSSSEGLSQAMLQAMLCELPVIVSDVGDLSDVVSNDVNGYLLDPCNKASLAAVLGDLLSDEEKLAEMGKRAREEALNYGIQLVGQRWDNLLMS